MIPGYQTEAQRQADRLPSELLATFAESKAAAGSVEAAAALVGMADAMAAADVERVS